MKVIVIIPAAGLGTRMAAGGTGKTSKQFYEIAGLPILIHTLRRFAECAQVTEMIVALRPSDIPGFQGRLLSEAFARKVQLVEGGENRQESVHKALMSANATGEDIVLVHDAVRPFVEGDVIRSVIAAAEKTGAAIAGLPAMDTVKQVDRTSEGAIITSTIPRERVVMAQTPQGFRCGLLRRAFDDAALQGYLGTDEASLVERIGQEVSVVMGSPRNLKITTPYDLELAEFITRKVATDSHG